MMHTVWCVWNLGWGISITITPWTIIGYSGTILFTLRWVVQAVASRQAGKPTVPRLFWYMSIVGSLLLLFYFIWGKNDGPGIVSNLFPGLLAVYNLFLDIAHHRKEPTVGGPGETPVEVA